MGADIQPACFLIHKASAYARKHIHRQFPQLPSNIYAIPSLGILGSSADDPSKVSLSTEDYLHWIRQNRAILSKRLRPLPRVTINVLPDDVLVEIFSQYVDQAKRIGAWYILVHVCHRWRVVVFSSSHRLDLQLLCPARRPIRKLLDVWPALPIAILDHGLHGLRRRNVDNIITTLGHHDRVRHIELWGLSSSLLGRFAAVMQEPFPDLTFLELLSNGSGVAPALPDPFFGGIASRLQTVHLKGIPFPPVRELLLSATDLVDLDLWNMPYSGYVSPEATVTCLAAMTRLKSLFLGFNSPRSCPDPEGQHLPPPTRTVLPALTHLKYRGVSETLEDLVSRIDAPLLDNAEITFFHQLILDYSRLPQLITFISRTNKFKVFDEARVLFQHRYAQVRLSPQTGNVDQPILQLKISCKESDWQLSSLAQVCNWTLPHYSTVERLEIREDLGRGPHWQDGMENMLWMELLRPFTIVKDLYLSEKLAPQVALALKEFDWVLPTLQNLFLDGHQPSRRVQEAIGPFISARQLSNYSVAVHHRKEGQWVVHAPGGQ